MAIGTYEPIRPFSPAIYMRGTVPLPEKASLACKVGAPLIYNGGYVEEAGTAPSTVAFIAAENGHNGASDGLYSILAWPITDDDLWEASFQDAYAIADNGGNFGLVKDATSGYWYVDEDDSGDQVVSFGPRVTPSLGAVGDTKFRGLIKFQAGNIAGY